METSSHNPREQSRSSPTLLRDYLVHAIEDAGKSSIEMPKAVNLCEFGSEAEHLVQLSRLKHSSFEYASVAYADDRRRIHLSRPIRGDEETVHLPSVPTRTRRVLIIHTHGEVDTPFSPRDLEVLFIHPSDARATPAALLATPTVKMLILRGRRTPFVPIDMIEEKVVERIFLHDAMSKEGELYKSRYDAAGGKEPLFTANYKQAFAQISNRRMFVLSRFAQECDLSIYSCPLQRNIAYSVS